MLNTKRGLFLIYVLICICILIASGNIALCDENETLKLVGGHSHIPHWIVTRESTVLKSIWMNEDGSEGWTVGTNGNILYYKNQEWKRHQQAGIVTNNALNALWMNSDCSEGWAVGEKGIILTYKDGVWKEVEQVDNTPHGDLNALWMCPGKTGKPIKGWAVGNKGEIVVYENGKWKKDEEGSGKISDHLNSIWMWISEDLKAIKGWAVGNKGAILVCQNGKWDIDKVGNPLTQKNLNSISMLVVQGKIIGWAVGDAGEILEYNGKSWKEYKKDWVIENTLERKLNSVVMWESKKGVRGWAVGNSEKKLFYNGENWVGEASEVKLTSLNPSKEKSNEKKEKSDDQAGKSDFTSLWLNKDGKKGWIIGSSGDIQSYGYEGQGWKRLENASKVADSEFTSLWMDKAGEMGWMVGSGGDILYYNKQNAKWQRFLQKADGVDYKQYTYERLNAFWMNTNGSNGWAVGDKGNILSFRRGVWKRDDSACTQTPINLNAIWMKADSSRGWVVGDGGVFLSYRDRDGGWRRDELSSGETNENLYAIWMDKDGLKGWAVGAKGVILRYRDGTWQEYKGGQVGISEKEKVKKTQLNAIWMKKDGSKGWAVGEEGEIIFYDGKNDIWRSYNHGGKITNHNLYSIIMNDEGTSGWAASGLGVLLFYDGKKWYSDNQGSPLTEEKLNYFWMNNNGTNGWGGVVGSNGTILQYSPVSVENATLGYDTKDTLMNLSGNFVLKTSHEMESIESMNLYSVSEGLPVGMLRKSKREFKNNQKECWISFSDIEETLKKNEKAECYLEFVVRYPHESLPIVTVYRNNSFHIKSPPPPTSAQKILKYLGKKYLFVIIIFFILFLIGFPRTTIRIANRCKLDKKFVKALLNSGSEFTFSEPLKSVILFIFRWRYLSKIREMFLLAGREILKKIPLVEKWESNHNNPPEVKIIGNLLEGESKDQYKQAFDHIMRSKEKQVWAIGCDELNSKDQALALLEYGVRYALEKERTPVYINLNKDTSPQDDLAGWLQDICEIPIEKDKVFPWVKDGCFLLLLADFKDCVGHTVESFLGGIVAKNIVIIASAKKITDYNTKKAFAVNTDISLTPIDVSS